MSKEVHHIQVVAGASWNMTLGVRQANGWRALTGMVATGGIAEKAGEAVVVSFSTNVRVNDEEIDIWLTPESSAELAALPGNDGEYDIRLEWPDGEVDYPVGGRVLLKRTVTP